MTDNIYKTYPNNEAYMRYYIEYQEKYAQQIRESDKVLLNMVSDIVRASGRTDLALADVGCSTGNLLKHLKGAFPNLKLTGIDLSEIQITAARNDPAAAGISFEVANILEMAKTPARFDIVVCNAMLSGFSIPSFAEAVRNVAAAIKPGGTFLSFEWFHPFEQELEIIERSSLFPDGYPLHFRSYGLTERVCHEAGLEKVEFVPFLLPLDLPHPGFNSVRTYTRNAADGERLQMRGILLQPWCHLIARRPA